jgi:hypothetical protein
MTRNKFFVSSCLALMFVLILMLSVQPTPAEAQTAQPTRTPRPAPTASTTPVASLDLPDWMRDPDAAVIVLFTHGEQEDDWSGATFINAVTDERFALNLPYVDEVAWVTATDGVYIILMRHQSSGADNSDGFSEFVNLETGALVRTSGDEQGVPIKISTPSVTPVKVENGANVTYQVVARAEWVTDDSSGIYRMQTTSDIILTDATTGQTTSLYNGKLSTTTMQSLGVQWFDEGRLLGVWFHYKDEDPSAPREVDGGDSVEIYDASGKFQFSLGELWQVRWSARHGRVLYREYYDNDSICILDTKSPNLRDYNCDFFKTWQSQQHNQIRDYQWSLDGQKIIFTYVREDKRAGGLCVVDAETLTIDCPIKKALTEGTFRGSYRYQPENVYGFFSYNNGFNISEPSDQDIARETGLCLVNQRDYRVDCVTDRVLPAGTYYSETSLSPSKHLAAMMYTAPNFTHHDGACIIDLQSGAVNCPDTSKIYGLIDTYGWSPDNRFFLVMYGYGRSSDDKSNSSFGIFDIEAGTYRDQGYAMHEHNISELWRPLLKP